MITDALPPELLRNARIQLRPGRMLSAAAICAALSITSWIFYADVNNAGPWGGGYLGLFKWILFLQVSVLAMGGGAYCLQSIHREKELNTFDYQRVTRSTPLELTIGKLFGAPAMPYFAFLCLMPASLVAALLSSASGGAVLEAYLVLVLGAIAFHALALVASLLIGRGGSAGLAAVYLLFVTVVSLVDPNTGNTGLLTLHRVSPYFALDLLSTSSDDVFFGIGISHVVLLALIFVTFTAWFLAAVARNIKRDPTSYEVYSPLLAFALVLYMNLLLLGFFNWSAAVGYVPTPPFGAIKRPPMEDLQILLSFNLWLFLILGVTLLRNRDRVRRRIREFGIRAADWWSSAWPASYLLAGLITVGAVTLAAIELEHKPIESWNLGMALFEVAFLAVWLGRDLLYLQWMNLRGTRHPLVSAVLYLVVFYVCAGVLMGTLNVYRQPGTAPFAAFFLPSPVFGALDSASWQSQQHLWLLALGVQLAEALVFVWLQRQRLREFAFASTQAAH